MKRSLYSDPHVDVTLEDEIRVVRYVRTSERYPSLETVRELHQKMREALSALPRGTLALLVDVRAAPARNDDPFEAEITSALRSIMPRFSAHAVLVKSAVGRLQVQRLAKNRGTGELAVFVDEAEALEHLRAAVAKLAN